MYEQITSEEIYERLTEKYDDTVDTVVRYLENSRKFSLHDFIKRYGEDGYELLEEVCMLDGRYQEKEIEDEIDSFIRKKKKRKIYEYYIVGGGSGGGEDPTTTTTTPTPANRNLRVQEGTGETDVTDSDGNNIEV